MKSKRVFKYIVLAVSLVTMSLGTACGGGGGEVDTGLPNLTQGRWGHSATMLQNGTVLVVGGDTKYSTRTNSVEIYDLAGTWSPGPTLLEKRGQGHSATLLTDGRVLIAGNELVAEVYDPFDGTWTLTGNMSKPRNFHASTLLNDGRVLVAGGTNADNRRELAASEIFDPATGEWTPTGDLNYPTERPVMTVLGDGTVFLVGRDRGEVYDPQTGVWSEAGKPTESRWGGSTVTLLNDGRVLVAGGEVLPGSQGNNLSQAASGQATHIKSLVPTAKTDYWDPEARTFVAGPPMSEARKFHTATVLPDGKILMIGNQATEMYDQSSGQWVPGPMLLIARTWGATTNLLSDGKVLVVGGVSGVKTSVNPNFTDWLGMGDVEIYDPAAPLED